MYRTIPQRGHKKHHNGFTLVELLIVIIIIGIIAGMLMMSAGGAADKAAATKIVNNMRALKSACLLYYADHGTWPLDDDNKGDISLLKDYIDQNIGSNYTIERRNSSSSKKMNGSVFVKFTFDKDYTEHNKNDGDVKGIKRQLELMAKRANLWNSTTNNGDGYNKDNMYYMADDINSGKKISSNTVHMPVYLVGAN
ncbi:type II secretion system protein [Cloacibacillus evryensis]|uniref:type II secretion system protein n=1 Tax=Cloacibacillus evryensis TaxID=508460 RepID=UPI000240E181|nr:prepilin-type N-terminal cleavage/methylation domain-containing protein [Cloacibacillus evryensis]EHL65476.1 prepilin-type N-terminal cleavage/methylation domain-containing protein [Synergistes sp. 3_1_syn1]